MKRIHRYEKPADYAADTFLEEAKRRDWSFERWTTEEVTYLLISDPGESPLKTVFVSLDKDSGILEMASCLTEKMSDSKKQEAAVIINAYNLGRLLGMIEMDLSTGKIWYKIKMSIAGCWINSPVWEKLLDYISKESRLYGELLMKLDCAVMTMEQILQLIDQG